MGVLGRMPDDINTKAGELWLPGFRFGVARLATLRDLSSISNIGSQHRRVNRKERGCWNQLDARFFFSFSPSERACHPEPRRGEGSAFAPASGSFATRAFRALRSEPALSAAKG